MEVELIGFVGGLGFGYGRELDWRGRFFVGVFVF